MSICATRAADASTQPAERVRPKLGRLVTGLATEFEEHTGEGGRDQGDFCPASEKICRQAEPAAKLKEGKVVALESKPVQ